jgi:hypothetical protein
LGRIIFLPLDVVVQARCKPQDVVVWGLTAVKIGANIPSVGRVAEMTRKTPESDGRDTPTRHHKALVGGLSTQALAAIVTAAPAALDAPDVTQPCQATSSRHSPLALATRHSPLAARHTPHATPQFEANSIDE